MTSLYDFSVPMLIRQLQNLDVVLRKGEKWCEDNNKDKSVLLEGKLADDMLPLPFQIQSASNSSKGILFRIGGEQNTPMEDNEKTFPELYERIEKTIDLLKKAKRENFKAADEPCTMSTPKRTLEFKTSLQFLQNFALPNIYFHLVAAYAILRQAGVDVGKLDYLGMGTMTD